MRIVLCYPVAKQHVEAIRAAAPKADVFAAEQDEVAHEILAADVFCGHPKVPMPWQEVAEDGRLQWIQSSAAGLDHCLVPPVVESEIIVTSASGVLADQVTEHVIALITALTRSLPVFLAAQQRREFIRRPTRDLHHSTIGIVGFGGVGRRLAEVLSAFKTRIVATDYFPYDKPDYVEALWPPERLDDMLGEIDVLVLAAPLTDQTRGMIDARRMARLRKGALLINAARGPLLVEDDLVDALESGHLGGAAVDVTDTEPLPKDSPLWTAPRLIITPHVAGQSARRMDDMTRLFCENLQRYSAGRELINQVDKRLGFPVRTPSNHVRR